VPTGDHSAAQWIPQFQVDVRGLHIRGFQPGGYRQSGSGNCAWKAAFPTRPVEDDQLGQLEGAELP
jgi:hypothetical protein